MKLGLNPNLSFSEEVNVRHLTREEVTDERVVTTPK